MKTQLEVSAERISPSTMVESTLQEVSQMELPLSDIDYATGSWELVTGRKRPMTDSNQPVQSKRLNESIPTTTYNSFQVLSQTTNAKTEETINPPQIDKIPPIFINGVEDYAALISFLEHEAGPNTFKTRSTIKGVTVYPQTPDIYRKLNTSLRNKGADYHTYQLPQDRCPRIVVKHLHHGTPIDIIKEEFKKLGYEVTNVVNAISRFKNPLPMFFVDITKESFSEEIFKIEFLYYSHIKIEEPRKKRIIPQCMRCQQYGHTKSYCNHHPRCVKCGEFHDSSSCLKTRDKAPKCANCKGEHPANYRGCQTLKDLRAQRRLRSHPPAAAQPAQEPPSIHEFPPLPQRPNQRPPHITTEPQQQPAPNAAPQKHQTCKGMRRGSAQAVPPIVNNSPQLITVINSLNNLIQPLFTLLQQLSQITQVWCPAYDQ